MKRLLLINSLFILGWMMFGSNALAQGGNAQVYIPKTVRWDPFILGQVNGCTVDFESYQDQIFITCPERVLCDLPPEGKQLDWKVRRNRIFVSYEFDCSQYNLDAEGDQRKDSKTNLKYTPQSQSSNVTTTPGVFEVKTNVISICEVSEYPSPALQKVLIKKIDGVSAITINRSKGCVQLRLNSDCDPAKNEDRIKNDYYRIMRKGY